MSFTCNSDNRISLKFQCPNPLFEKWLTEWKDQAKAKNSKTQYTYSLALQSLRKYPLPLEKGRDCKILKGFGNKLCEMLDDSLRRYRDGGNSKTQAIIPDGDGKNSSSTLKTNQIATTKKNKQEYSPTIQSGPYAILLSLYKNLSEQNQTFMYKKDLIREAQPFCATSFTKSEPGSYYTAWSTMSTLISKNLVKKESNPAKYSLTNEGILLGSKLYTINRSESKNLSSSLGTNNEQIDEGTRKMLNKQDSEIILSSFGEAELDGFDPDKIIVTPGLPEPISSELNKICGTFSLNKIEVNEVTNSKKDIQSTTKHKDIIFEAQTFDIILYVDTQETCGALSNPHDDPILTELKHSNVKYEVRNLKVGDYCWICRDRKSSEELVTPYIIERKRMDDLAKSIKDGRFYEQKFRLKQCGLQNVIYMIESYGKKDEHVGMPLNSLHQAAVNTLVQDGFCLKYVEGVRGVAEYLSSLTNLINKYYKGKTLVSCPKENLRSISISDDLVSLMFFNDFNKQSSKSKNFTVKEMFIRQLLQLKGLSVERAAAVIEIYPTPYSLKVALVENEKSINKIANIKYGKLGKKIGPLLANTIYQLFTKSSF